MAALPEPRLRRVSFGAHGGSGDVVAVTDERLFAECGVRVAFAERGGGVSTGAYASLNVGDRVDDDAVAVARNRAILLDALGAHGMPCVNPVQVHGDVVVALDAAQGQAFDDAAASARAGADAVVVGCDDVAALLCFADCLPVVAVAPGGAFAVAHAGWRGVVAHTAPKAIRRLCAVAGCAPADCNVYLGPHIHAECFEVGEDVARQFEGLFGSGCLPKARHVDMAAAMRGDLAAMGCAAERIVDVGACTACENGRFFSYRAQGGVCGRHAAVAFRRNRER